MASLAQLQSESWWNAETTPGALAALGAALRQHFKLPALALGFKGDRFHLNGYHRSRAWVKASRFCTNDTYSVSETPGNRKGGDVNWVCALDVTLPTKDLLAVCKRLDAASRAGVIEKVTQWYGNKDGNQQVDGWDNIRNEVDSSDDSHLWHLHMSFDRGRANENHTDVLNIMTGGTMTPKQEQLLKDTAYITRNALQADGVKRDRVDFAVDDVRLKLTALTKTVAELATRPPVTPAELAAIVTAAEAAARDEIGDALRAGADAVDPVT